MSVVSDASPLIDRPWKPTTRASAMRLPKYGSSPAPSTIRPHRASRAMSTIGANVQWRPTAAASRAATRAAFSTAPRSHDAASARGTGKMVLNPWITSYPKISGMPRRDSSTATCCARRV